MAYQEKLYDLTKLEESLEGDQDALREMVSAFIEFMPQNLEQMNNCLSAKDYQGVGQAAHKLKGPLRSIEIKGVIDDIRTIEECGLTSTNTEKIDELVPRVNQTMDAVFAQLAEQLGIDI